MNTVEAKDLPEDFKETGEVVINLMNELAGPRHYTLLQGCSDGDEGESCLVVFVKGSPIVIGELLESMREALEG